MGLIGSGYSGDGGRAVGCVIARTDFGTQAVRASTHPTPTAVRRFDFDRLFPRPRATARTRNGSSGGVVQMPDSASESGISMTGATVRMADRTILGPLTLTLGEQRVGIVGRNGSGKTTLLRLMAGLIAPSSGEVRVDGIDPSGDRRGVIARLGILFQNPDRQIIFPIVEEELAFGLRQLGAGAAEALAQARSRLAVEGRGHWAGASVETLSQGQRHYLCLLAVLLMKPATILLDEPFAGLDLPTTMQLRRQFEAVAQRLITVTHEPAMLAGYDRVIWLEAGRVRADGAAEAVLADYVACMTAEGNRDAGADLAG